MHLGMKHLGNKKMGQGLLLITRMTFFALHNYIFEYSGVGWQDMLHNVRLKNGKSYIFGYTLKELHVL